MSNFDILIKNGRIWNGTKFLIDDDSVAIKGDTGYKNKLTIVGGKVMFRR